VGAAPLLDPVALQAEIDGGGGNAIRLHLRTVMEMAPGTLGGLPEVGMGVRVGRSRGKRLPERKEKHGEKDARQEMTAGRADSR
jgi:hypothetical protein